MTRKKGRTIPVGGKQPTPIKSLYDAIQPGREYESLVAANIRNLNPIADIRLAIADIESVRGRPLLIYAGNTVHGEAGPISAITQDDDLPFCEMISRVPSDVSAIDILIVTPGGFAHQVARFVDIARRRFPEVDFMVPHLAMSAGTIWLLSGNNVWMDERAFIGPIDPQVMGKNGQFLPFQAIQLLVDEIQKRGQNQLKNGQQPNWTDIHILTCMDPKELGSSISASNYSIQLASSYLEKYKFRDWTNHSDGTAVTPDEKRDRALEIAKLLCAHEHWKAHSHGISREVAWQELKLKIKHPESVPGLQEATRKLWAMLYFCFQATEIRKVFASSTYSLIRTKPN